MGVRGVTDASLVNPSSRSVIRTVECSVPQFQIPSWLLAMCRSNGQGQTLASFVRAGRRGSLGDRKALIRNRPHGVRQRLAGRGPARLANATSSEAPAQVLIALPFTESHLNTYRANPPRKQF